MERDRCAVPLITSPNSRPLNQRVTGKEDVINKGDASQGGKRRGELKPVALAVAITLAIAITLGLALALAVAVAIAIALAVAIAIALAVAITLA